MADNIKYRFIQNVGDYFPSGYFSEDFIDKVQKASGVSADEMSALCSPYVQLRREYDAYKNYIVNSNPRVKDAILHTHDFNDRLLQLLGYEPQGQPYKFYAIDEEAQTVVPVRMVLSRGGQTTMLVMEMQHLIQVGDLQPSGLFEQRYNVEGDEQRIRHQQYYAGQWSGVFTLPDDVRISPSVINKAIDALFLLPPDRRPHYILMLAGNTVFLLNVEKWNRGAYLQFSLDELFSQASISAFRKYYALFHLLVCKETLAADSETVLMDRLVEESYKSAYEVTKDLKNGVVLAVESLANEALYWWKQTGTVPVEDYTDDTFEAKVKDDCLTIVYRLLFIFYAESRDELEILPTNDEVYNQGYSLEMLRDLEKVPLISDSSRNGFFIDDSLRQLFRLLSTGYHENRPQGDKSFTVMHIDSPLFNNRRLNYLGDVRIRNIVWQQIIQALSLSRHDKQVGRISYANLGVNQLGSVYESLLAYRGFYAEEDYIEVHKAGKPEEGTFLVPYSRMDDFQPNEILRDSEARPQILKQGTFVYRLNGRDRQKSASYYTPEILTRSTVKYTLKAIIDEVAAGKRKATELLDLKILEPAMGAAAFQNEVINQLAEAYLTYQQQQKREDGSPNWRIAPDHYRDELQKVKAYIATHNVYGVDLNPTAIELGKLSLWLNVIHKDMETPFFSNRLALGNAVIGAWLKVYNKEEFYGIKGRSKLEPNPWWEKAPHKVKFFKNRVNRSVNEIYHFLLPDKTMLAVRNISEQKKARPTETNKMNTLIKDWTKPITDRDFNILKRLSSKIDLLLKEYFQFQQSIENLTQNRGNVWGAPGAPVLNLDTYEEKERLNDVRYRHDNAYFRLKMVMDYWCALWFWEYDHTPELPNREEYWSDIEAMLNVSDQELNAHTTRKLHNVHIDKNGQLGVFHDGYMNDMFEQAKLESMVASEPEPIYNTDEDSEIIQLSKEEVLAKTKGTERSFFDESERFDYAKKLADRYHFFHPMLEFLEVFWLRDGFDIICGNPPWLKVEFDEKGIVSEKFPEVIIKNISSADVHKNISNYLIDKIQTDLFMSELHEYTCQSAFMSAFANYPLLQKQKNDLYKSVLTNGFDELSEHGYMGLLHPETVFDDTNAQVLRKEVYHRLRYHFQYTNELTLFAEVDHHTKYGEHIYGNRKENINFISIHNLFHPNTIDGCFSHDGSGTCGGIKTEDGKWNIASHKLRLVNFNQHSLEVLAKTFENNSDWETVKLVGIHNSVILNVLSKISDFNSVVNNYSHIVQYGFDETMNQKKGIIKNDIRYPDVDKYEMICSGPHFFVGNPLYKCPRENCKLNSDYDVIDLQTINESYSPRTIYVPSIPTPQYTNLFKGFQIGMEDGSPLYDNWIDYYKVGFRKMVGPMSERTLSGAILPPKYCHINGVVSITFKNPNLIAEFAGLTSSIVMDFYLKSLGSSNLYDTHLVTFPLGVEEKYQSVLYSRTLMLNCLTRHYSELWSEVWSDDFRNQTWSIDDPRLKPFSSLQRDWSWDTPLRNYFERRQALVEIDVIAAMALGLSLQDLEMIYTIQFPVLQQNENDTWYDRKGNIVFTCSKGLTGVGVDRPQWEQIRNMQEGETYVHTIEKSELYHGQQVTYYAPFTKCDRIEDYRKAWAHFEKVFADK